MVILIGDEPPHSQGKGGNCQWLGGKIVHTLETDYKLEAKRFADGGVPVHAFYMANTSTMQSRFSEIGSITNGSATYLDPNRAQDILDVVSRNVVLDIDPDYAKEYDSRYKKTYTS